MQFRTRLTSLARLGLIVMLLVACSGARERSGYEGFEKYVDSFVETAHFRGYVVDTRRLQIHYVLSLPGSEVGVCGMESGHIDVLHWYFFLLDDIKKEQLIWHEMGHCVMGRGHITDLNADGKPISIMYPSSEVVWDEQYYVTHKNDYIKEMWP